MKSPLADEGTAALRRLESEAGEAHEAACSRDAAEALAAEAELGWLRKELARLARKGAAAAEERRTIAERIAALGARPTPRARRFVVVDATVEKLGELLRDNPRGLTCLRDEISGWAQGLDRKGREGDRGFFLSAWNGSGLATVDRIGRGTVAFRNPTIALFGTTQPDAIARLVAEASTGGRGDGLIARFSLAAWPDPAPYRPVDRRPDRALKLAVDDVFRRLAEADFAARGAEVDPSRPDDPPFLRLSAEAQPIFDGWFDALSARLADWTGDAAMASHLAKYKKLAPALGLLHQLCSWDAKSTLAPVSAEAVRAAIGWCGHLEAHARRVYGCKARSAFSPGAVLAGRIDELPSPFKARDLARRKWSGLATPESVERALEEACERRWIMAAPTSPGRSGRPTVAYHRNPRRPGRAVPPPRAMGEPLGLEDLFALALEFEESGAAEDVAISPSCMAAGLVKFSARNRKLGGSPADVCLSVGSDRVSALEALTEAVEQVLGRRDSGSPIGPDPRVNPPGGPPEPPPPPPAPEPGSPGVAYPADLPARVVAASGLGAAGEARAPAAGKSARVRARRRSDSGRAASRPTAPAAPRPRCGRAPSRSPAVSCRPPSPPRLVSSRPPP